jgi:hypothetical protein
MNRIFARRRVLVAGGLGALSALLYGQPVAAAARRKLDLSTPQDNVYAYLKMRASVATQDVYFWFTGRLDIAIPGEPVRPLVDVESLILRRTERRGELEWTVTDWEAAFYRDPKSHAIIEGAIDNPVTGERVTPAPYTEGPVRFRFTDREPRIVGSRDVMPNTGKPFNYPWRLVGDDIWMTKSSYIEAPNWLDPKEWPLESSGPKVIVATHSSLRAKWSDVQNPRSSSVPVDFAYTATSSWLPWMRMGQRAGHLVWAESGKKLFSLEEAPAEQLAAVRKFHPQWFQRPEPWPEFTNMYLRYKAAHRPAMK